MLQQTRIIIDRNVAVGMRDGIILYADIYRQLRWDAKACRLRTRVLHKSC